MDEGYEKIMEIIEMNRFRQRLGLLDYTALKLQRIGCAI